MNDRFFEKMAAYKRADLIQAAEQYGRVKQALMDEIAREHSRPRSRLDSLRAWLPARWSRLFFRYTRVAPSYENGTD